MNFFRMIYHNLRYGVASTVIFIDNQVDAALASMVRAVIFVFGLILIGTIVGGIGYWLDDYFLMRAAQYIFAFDYFAGGFLSLILAARFGVLITVLPLAYNLIRRIVHEATDPLPFMDGVDLPEALSRENAAFIYRILWASLATLQLIGCYAILFPIYTNPLSFLVVLGAGWGIVYGALTVGVGGEWLKRYGYANVAIGALMIIGFTLTYPFPNIWTSFIARWNGMWNSFGSFEALAAVNYWVAVLYFIVIVGFLISIAHFAWTRRGAGVMVGFLVALLFLMFLGTRTVDAIGNITPNLGSRSNNAGSSNDEVVPPGAYSPNNTSGALSVGSIPVSKPFTDVGTYSGRIIIVMSGKAKLDSTREDFSPEGWIAGGGAPGFFALPGAKMFSSIARVGGKIVPVGNSIQLDLSVPTRIELGPNEEPGKDGLGYKDNGGTWSYEVRRL
jgi:hypothetical protein